MEFAQIVDASWKEGRFLFQIVSEKGYTRLVWGTPSYFPYKEFILYPVYNGGL
jgi:hypothetical protein